MACMVLAFGSLPVFDLDLSKLVVLGVVALIVFGPDRLPSMAAQAGRALRELRKMAEGAKSELEQNLGPEFSQFDLNDINPKHFVRKHLLDDIGDPLGLSTFGGTNGSNGTNSNNGITITNQPAPAAVQAAPPVLLAPGEQPPYDADAT
jgi:sec-independent protein translocase protein TatB